MNPLLEQFLQEARENLAFIDQNIEEIGSNDPELLNAVFRAAHTLKGGSGIVGFEAVKEITHHAEDLLDMLRSNQIPFQEAMIEALYNAFDEVMNLIEAAEETEDIVEADDATVAQIIEELSSHMGKSAAAEAWSVPFNLMQDPHPVVDVPMPFLATLKQPLPFEIGSFGEAEFGSEQLYAVLFDVDESCMVYGNDPVYTLSLLGDKVCGVYSCMSEASAKSVLSGLDDPDGLNLNLQMTAFIRATYEEIEDALFNFIDELQFLPLDIATLLKIRRGEEGHALDVLKEFGTTVAGPLADGDRDAVAAEIEKSMQLVGKDTIQYAQLERAAHLCSAVESSDLEKLSGFFAALPEGNTYSYDGAVPAAAEAAAAVETIETAEAEAVPAASAEAAELTPQMQEQIGVILEQQYNALQHAPGDESVERVTSILQEHLAPYMSSMPASFGSAAELMQWIGSELGIETAEAPVAAPVVEEAPAVVETPAPVKAAVTVEPAAAPKSAATPKPAAAPEPAPSQPEKAEVVPKEAVKKSVIGKTVKIEQESVDNLMNIVGELLVAKNSLPYLADGVGEMNSEMIRRAIMEKYTFINRLAEQLQDLIMSMRMLPISYVFDRYPKLVRDISKNLGKKVKLEMEGGETKLDKNMIEMLADPMIHIMRNSLDHGIEMPDIREQKGKTAEGNISLNAYAQSDKIIIEIKDDGAGINVDKVITKVLEKGLATIEQIDAMSDDEKAELVMLPGLSTAEAISEYSGRGVGMDVVRKSIENFGGSIRIRTMPNQGTTITLAIPLSLAVTSLLHVSMSGVHYGFPMDSVSETVKIEKEEIEYLHNEPFVYIRGEVIPLLFMKSMLDEEALEGKPLPIVVLNIKGNLLAVVVNELLGQLDVVQKPLEGVMDNHPIFSGTALLGNGQIIMAIDPLGLLGIAHVLKDDDRKVG